MKTATTLQLLDANNNNISPAVCVDSMYFEKDINGRTYRMSLKNRTIVASDTMNINFSIDTTKDLKSLELPYFTVTKTSSQKNDFIWQLNTSTCPVGETIDRLIDEKLKQPQDSYSYSKVDSDKRYLHVDGTNKMNSHFYVGTSYNSNGISHNLKIFSENSISGISFIRYDAAENNKAYEDCSLWYNTNNDIMNINNKGSIFMESIGGGTIKTTSDVYDTNANRIKMYARENNNSSIIFSAPIVEVYSSSTRISTETIHIGG